MSQPIQYNAHLSTSQLFVGTIFHEEITEKDEDGWPMLIDEYWEQEPEQISYDKLKEGIESLGIKCIDIHFGDYDPYEGTLTIKSIRCEYDGPLLNALLNDECYIRTGISCNFCNETPIVAIYFDKEYY